MVMRRVEELELQTALLQHILLGMKGAFLCSTLLAAEVQ